MNAVFLYLLIVSCFVLFILSIVAVWRQGRRSLLSWFIVPFVIFNVGFGWYTVEQLHGWPYYNKPRDHSELLYGHVTKQYIYLLVNVEDHGPRLYAIDYTPDDAKQVQQAMESKQAGQRVIVKSETQSMQSLEFYNFDVRQALPEKKQD